jgi:hypothetical protein
VSRRKVTYLLTALFVLIAIAVPLRYSRQHSMLVAGSHEVGNAVLEPRVLIATQGSSFKDALVDGIAAHLKPRVGYLEVLDVSRLPEIRENEWAAVVVMHTWEYGKPQADAAAFVARAADKSKLIVVTTSGGGREKMPGIDVISAASEMRDVPMRVAEVTRVIDAVLDKRPAATDLQH